MAELIASPPKEIEKGHQFPACRRHRRIASLDRPAAKTAGELRARLVLPQFAGLTLAQRVSPARRAWLQVGLSALARLTLCVARLGGVDGAVRPGWCRLVQGPSTVASAATPSNWPTSHRAPLRAGPGVLGSHRRGVRLDWAARPGRSVREPGARSACCPMTSRPAAGRRG